MKINFYVWSADRDDSRNGSNKFAKHPKETAETDQFRTNDVPFKSTKINHESMRSRAMLIFMKLGSKSYQS